MDEAIKNFTMIDYLGILIPGLTLLYAAQPVRDVVTPELLSDHVVLALSGIIIAGYILGSALAQTASMLEDALWHLHFWQNAIVPADYFEDTVIQEAYCFVYAVDSVPDTKEKQCAAAGDIFHYVQRETRPERIVIFTAFYTMARTLFTTFCLILLLMRTGQAALPLWAEPVCAVLAVLFLLRWVQFDRKCVTESRLLFRSYAPRFREAANEGGRIL